MSDINRPIVPTRLLAQLGHHETLQQEREVAVERRKEPGSVVTRTQHKGLIIEGGAAPSSPREHDSRPERIAPTWALHIAARSRHPSGPRRTGSRPTACG